MSAARNEAVVVVGLLAARFFLSLAAQLRIERSSVLSTQRLRR
jgi:hypothetical protein